MGTLWHSISPALSVALLVVALAALHTSKHWIQHKQRNATVTQNVKREKNSYTTPHIENKHNGSETQPPPATYAVYPSCQETLSKLTMLKQETQTHNYLQPTAGATPVEVAAHSPSSHNQQLDKTSNKINMQTTNRIEHIYE